MPEATGTTMPSTHTFYYFAFTYRFFSYGRSGQAKNGREVLKT
jgi:hypothetical protein